MGLTTANLVIDEPCHADWDEMSGDEKKRFCGACQKDVHDLTELREADAIALLESSANLCVRYAHRPDGTVRFADSPVVAPAPKAVVPEQLLRQRRGVRSLVTSAALALAVSGGLAACTPTESNAATEVVHVDGVINNEWLRNAAEQGEAGTEDLETSELVAQPEPNTEEVLGGAPIYVPPTNDELLRDSVEPVDPEKPETLQGQHGDVPPPELFVLGEITVHEPDKSENDGTPEDDAETSCDDPIEAPDDDVVVPNNSYPVPPRPQGGLRYVPPPSGGEPIDPER